MRLAPAFALEAIVDRGRDQGVRKGESDAEEIRHGSGNGHCHRNSPHFGAVRRPAFEPVGQSIVLARAGADRGDFSWLDFGDCAGRRVRDPAMVSAGWPV